MCVTFIRKWRDLQFNVDSYRQIFEKLFRANLEFLLEICSEEVAKEIFFILMSDLGFVLIHYFLYLIDDGDFNTYLDIFPNIYIHAYIIGHYNPSVRTTV